MTLSWFARLVSSLCRFAQYCDYYCLVCSGIIPFSSGNLCYNRPWIQVYIECAFVSTKETYYDPENGYYLHYIDYSNYVHYCLYSYYINYLCTTGWFKSVSSQLVNELDHRKPKELYLTMSLPLEGSHSPLNRLLNRLLGDVTRFLSRKRKETGNVTRFPRRESVDSNGRKSIDRFLLYLSSGCAHTKTTYNKPLMNVINHNKHSEGEGIDVKAEVI